MRGKAASNMAAISLPRRSPAIRINTRAPLVRKSRNLQRPVAEPLVFRQNNAGARAHFNEPNLVFFVAFEMVVMYLNPHACFS
jgi:hypothetical protein